MMEMLFSFVSCATPMYNSDVFEASNKFAILNGPPGLGAVKMIRDSDDFEFETLPPSADRILESVKNAEFDVIIVPSNFGAIIHNKQLGYRVIAVVLEAGFYIVTRNKEIKSAADLKGKLIHCCCKGAGPDFVLQYTIKQAGLTNKDVQINYLKSPHEISKSIISGTIDTAIMIEPFVTMAQTQAKDLHIAIRPLGGDKIPLAVLVAKTDFLKKTSTNLKKILSDYKTSTDFIIANAARASDLISEAGITMDYEAIVASIQRLGLVCYIGEKMKNELSSYYEFLHGFDAASIGGAMPKDDFYCIK